MTRDDIKRMEREYEAAQSNLADMKARLIEAKIELGNAEFAARGISVGDRVRIETPVFHLRDGAAFAPKVTRGIFVGFGISSSFGTRVEAVIKKIKKDGAASQHNQRVAYNAQISPETDQ